MIPELSISKILLPVDFSERAEEAVPYAARLARRFNSQVILLHVLEPLHLDFAMVELPYALEGYARARCAKTRAQLEHFDSPDFEGIRVIRRVSEGEPSEVILAEAEGVDLVVMATQGNGGLREFLIGSVTAKVLHDCHRPVLTGVHLGRPSGPQDWQVDHVLCAIDFGPESENVLNWGAHLAIEFGSQVTVVHAGTEPNAMRRVQEMVQAAGLKATALVTAGEPHSVVAASARDGRADLVIIGRGSAVGTLGRLRAQAYEIVRKSPCPVLSV